jgi:N-formylglutamate amidohydrolase
MDYGHSKYLDQLLNERRSVSTALEKIERRTTEVLYENQKWFKWVRQCQDEEEAAREKEAKKAKLENAMFKRYIKEMNRRQKELRDKESRKRQDIFLERLYKARMAEKRQQQQGGEEDEDDDDEDWDPIDEVLEDHRGNYIGKFGHDVCRDASCMANFRKILSSTSCGSMVLGQKICQMAKPKMEPWIYP